MEDDAARTERANEQRMREYLREQQDLLDRYRKEFGADIVPQNQAYVDPPAEPEPWNDPPTVHHTTVQAVRSLIVNAIRDKHDTSSYDIIDMVPDGTMDHTDQSVSLIFKERDVAAIAGIPLRYLAGLRLVAKERRHQDKKYGGYDHDRRHTVAEWHELIRLRNAFAAVESGNSRADVMARRKHLIQTAALALAAWEASFSPDGEEMAAPPAE